MKKLRKLNLIGLLVLSLGWTFLLTRPLFGKTAQAYCTDHWYCWGGCVAYSNTEAYCSSSGCECNCIYLDPFGNWVYSPQPCPRV